MNQFDLYYNCANELRRIPDVTLKEERDYIEDHMYTETPTFWVYYNEKLIGHIRYDKCMVSPERYLSYSIRLKGTFGANKRINDTDSVVDAFKNRIKQLENPV